MTTRKKQTKEHEKKKQTRDAALMKGTEDLLGMGFDLEALEPSPEAVARLAGITPPSLEASRALACWLGFAELREAADLLLQMERETGDKELKREIRRSLFRLEQHGISIPQTAESGPAPVAREMDRGYLSPVDARGDQVVWFVREEPGGDYLILSGVVSDRGGMVEADAGRVARAALRDLLDKTYARFGLRMLQADSAWCDLLLHEAYKRSVHRRNPGVSRFPSYRMEISHQLPEPMESPIRSLLAQDAFVDRADLLASSRRLLDEREMSGWILEPAWVSPHLEAFQGASESPLVLNRFQKEEREGRALREAAEGVLATEAKEIYARRMEAMAYYFHLDGRTSPARQALAVASSLGTTSPQLSSEIPFVIELVRRSLEAATTAARAKDREEKGPSLIVRPTTP